MRLFARVLINLRRHKWCALNGVVSTTYERRFAAQSDRLLRVRQGRIECI